MVSVERRLAMEATRLVTRWLSSSLGIPHKYNPRVGRQASQGRLSLRTDAKGGVEGLDNAGCSGCIEMYAGGRVRVRWIGWDPVVNGASVDVVLFAEAVDVVSVSSGVAVVGGGAGAGMNRAHKCG